MIRPATAADLLEFFGYQPRMTMTAWVLRMDGKPVAVAGLARRFDCLELFWDIAPGYEGAMKTMAVLRTVKAVMRRIEDSRIPVIAHGENPALLERLGFVRIEGDDFQWVGSPDKTLRRTRPAACVAAPE